MLVCIVTGVVGETAIYAFCNDETTQTLYTGLVFGSYHDVGLNKTKVKCNGLQIDE